VIKVIRPQDMPLQVANDNFDLAITGIDWLTDHLDMFPGSPVQALVDFKVSWVRIVAAVAGDVPVIIFMITGSYVRKKSRPSE